MKVNKAKQFHNWQNPLAINLLQKYDYEKNILEIIELESENLLTNLSLEIPSYFKDVFFYTC